MIPLEELLIKWGSWWYTKLRFQFSFHKAQTFPKKRKTVHTNNQQNKHSLKQTTHACSEQCTPFTIVAYVTCYIPLLHGFCKSTLKNHYIYVQCHNVWFVFVLVGCQSPNPRNYNDSLSVWMEKREKRILSGRT